MQFSTLIILVGSIASAEEKKPGITIDGTWKLVSHVLHGKARTIKSGEDRVTFEKGKVTIHIQPVETGSYKLKLGSKPYQIDLTLTRGDARRMLGIFELKDGALKICLSKPGSRKRPPRMESTETSETALLTFERVKN